MNESLSGSPTDNEGEALIRLLVVEDDATTRMLVRSMCAREGYDVVLARDGCEGVAQFEDAEPDLVLMDVMMPNMDGFEACRRIRRLDRAEGTPIIMLTGADDIAAIAQAFDAGATDFITKPINWPLLMQRIRYAIRGGQLWREARRSRLRQASVRRIAQIAFWSWDPMSRAFEWSDELESLLGYTGESLATLEDLIDYVHDNDRERVRRAFQTAESADLRIELEFRLQGKDGERIIRLVGERGGEGRDSERLFGAVQNITDTRRAEALVDYLALHDELTGLSNRRLFGRTIQQFTSAQRDVSHAVLLVAWLDLARFHRYNDELGETVGDTLLKLVAQRLKMLVNEGEVARVGGDEFAVLIQAPDVAEAMQSFEHLLDALDHPFKVAEDELHIGVSAGVACCPDDAVQPEELLALAQEAQRHARNQGRRVLAAHEIEAPRSGGSLDVERALRRALANGELHLVYQPQMSLREGRIVGVEALLRWQHPERGLVSPVEFVPVLEETGQILEVGAWVVAEACRQARRWELAGTPLRIGINLSPKQFLEPGLFEIIVNSAREAGVSSRLIELEITESLAMQNPERAINLLERLRALGYRIAIDDFGIGYSSLEYLLRFPLDVIKIDRTFVTRITERQADRAIVRAITAIAQTMRAATIAEGIETLRQCDFIEALGVSEIQGYLIGKPMSVSHVEKLLESFCRPGISTASV